MGSNVYFFFRLQFSYQHSSTRNIVFVAKEYLILSLFQNLRASFVSVAIAILKPYKWFVFLLACVMVLILSTVTANIINKGRKNKFLPALRGAMFPTSNCLMFRALASCGPLYSARAVLASCPSLPLDSAGPEASHWGLTRIDRETLPAQNKPDLGKGQHQALVLSCLWQCVGHCLCLCVCLCHCL